MVTNRRIHSFSFLLIGSLIGLGASACGGDDNTNVDVGRVDSGRRGDASVRMDSMPNPDDTGTTTPDTGTPDSGTPDSGMPDTGRPDSGMPDTGRPDTGMPDTGRPDTGVPDTGRPDAVVIPDTGPRDTGVRPDAMTPDVGPRDTGPRDTGTTDTGPRDTGTPDTGPRDTGVRPDATTPDTGPRDTGPRDTGTPDVGTPDGGTYVESAIPTPMFTDVCMTGTRVMLVPDRDDGHSNAAIPIPFTFTLFGTPYTTVWPVADGYAVLGGTMAPPSTAATAYGGQIPNMTLGAMVAAFYEDLDLSIRASPASDVCFTTLGTAPNRTFVIEWLGAGYFTGPGDANITAEAILYEGTNVVDIIFQHLDPGTMGDPTLASGMQASIGLQGPLGRPFIRHSGTVNIMTGVRFTPQ